MILQEEYVTFDVNRKMLRHCSPLRNLIYGALFYLVILLLAPVTINAEYDFSAASYVFACCAAFICGCLLIPRPIVSQEAVIRYSSAHLKEAVTILFLLSVIGVLAKILDSFFIRGISVSQDVLENRDVVGGGSANPVAIVAAFLMYPPYILLAILFCFDKYFQTFEKLIIWFLFGFQGFISVLMGSRSGLLFPGIFVALLCFYFRKVKLRFNLKILTSALVIFILGCILAGKMYSDRTLTLNPYAIIAETSRTSGSAATVPSNDTVYNLIYNSEEDSWSYYFLVGYVNICQYCLHGFLEFPAQKKYVDISSGRRTNGACMFDIYIKFFDKILGKEHADILRDAFVHPGIFNSVFGPIYTDFGWMGLIVMFFWGLIQQLVWRGAYKSGDFILLLWVFMGGMVIFLFPLSNLFSGPPCYAFTFVIIMYYMFTGMHLTQPVSSPELSNEQVIDSGKNECVAG